MSPGLMECLDTGGQVAPEARRVCRSVQSVWPAPAEPAHRSALEGLSRLRLRYLWIAAVQGRTTKSFIGFRELKPATANVAKSFRLNVLAPAALALLSRVERLSRAQGRSSVFAS